MRKEEIHAALRILRQEVLQWQEPVVGVVAKESRDPFRILIACVLSLRTKDRTTAEASERLFALASDPAAMLRLPVLKIQKAIYPVGFYRTKSKQIREICRRLLVVYGGRVPASIDELLTLPGVGRKTANLVVTVGYGKPGICVDIHVHRNRAGLVQKIACRLLDHVQRSPRSVRTEYLPAGLALLQPVQTDTVLQTCRGNEIAIEGAYLKIK
jgi:endonuclease-3